MADAAASPSRESRPLDNGNGSDRRERSRSRSPRRPPPEDETSQNNGSNLYVSGLSIRTRDQDLEDLFLGAGRVVKASVVVDPHTRESRRFAFVQMEDVMGANKAIELYNGYDLHGRKITVDKAKRSGPREATPGRYYGMARRDDRDRRDYRRDYRRDDRDRDYRRDDYRRDEYRRDDRDYRRDDYRGYDRDARRDNDRGHDRGYERGPDRYDRSPRGRY